MKPLGGSLDPFREGESLKKTLLSFLILVLFIYGIGQPSFFPSARLFQETEWDFSLLIPLWADRLISFLWIIPVGLGFGGWARQLRSSFFNQMEPEIGDFLGVSLALSFFSLYVFGLGINEILYWPLVFIFFAPMLMTGTRMFLAMFSKRFGPMDGMALALVIPLILWAVEYLSAPIVWDAVLDHFRYAREVSRLHQILFHWVNHTGDMPKGAELILAGFWSLGGESLSKVSSAIPALLTLGLFILFGREWKGNSLIIRWIFGSCPFFLALFAWGYVEGFLVFFEMLAVYCLWKALQEPKNNTWTLMTVYFLGTAFAVKYTAVLAIAAIGLIFIFEKMARKNPVKLSVWYFLVLVLPVLPWVLKNWLAFGNPVYPLATSLLGGGMGYSSEMEQGLLTDTGLPFGQSWMRIPLVLWSSFFTTSNAVNAALTPLVVMSLPWIWGSFKKRIGAFLFAFSILFFVEWFFVSTSFRHAAGGVAALMLLSAMSWESALTEKKKAVGILFGFGVFLSLWLCFSAQFVTTAPYASALGLEDPLLRLKRHYSYNRDTYNAYKGIEDHSNPKDKVIAFAVFQTYPLNRIAFVDFKWKKPIFFQWASQCHTAEQLVMLLRREGVRYFLFQQKEAEAMSKVENDFSLRGMPITEYERFWRYYMKPVGIFENSLVFETLNEPLAIPQIIPSLPGVSLAGERR